MRMFKVRIEKKDGATLVCENPADVDWLFSEAAVGDRIFIDVVDMTEEQLKNLPEFEGF